MGEKRTAATVKRQEAGRVFKTNARFGDKAFLKRFVGPLAEEPFGAPVFIAQLRRVAFGDFLIKRAEWYPTGPQCGGRGGRDRGRRL